MGYHEEMTLVRRAQAGCTESRNRLWESNLRLVFSIVNGIYLPLEHIPDAIQEGAMGMRRAIDKFDVERWQAFSTYAWYWINQAIRRYRDRRSFGLSVPAVHSRDFLRLYRESTDIETDADMTGFLGKLRFGEPKALEQLCSILRIVRPIELTRRHADVRSYRDPSVDPLHAEIDAEAIHRLLAEELPEREWYVVVRRFGLDGEPEATLETIGTVLGITRERVRQLEARALATIRRRMIATGMDARFVDGR